MTDEIPCYHARSKKAGDMMRSFSQKKARSTAIAAVTIAAIVGANVGGSTHASAADTTGTVTAFAPEALAVLNNEAISWQNQVLVNKTGAGFTAFDVAGHASASPIAAGVVKTSTLFNGLLVWIEGTTVKTANPGGTVTTLAGALSATADSMLGVGTQLWISRAGFVDRFSPTGAALGGATPLPASFAATSTMRMALGTDGNVWVVERNAGAGVDTLTRWSPTTGLIVGSPVNFPNGSADPIAITMGADGAAWIVEGGTSSIARIDATNAFSELPLPGANPLMIATGPDSAVWVTENATNNLSRLTFASGAFTRVGYPAPSSFGLKGITVGPDGNMWAVGSVANKVAKFGTVAPTTTTIATTTAAPTTTVAATTTAAPTTTTTKAPTTIAPTPITIVITQTKVCVKSSRKRVKVGKKYVYKSFCKKYVIR